MKSLIKNNLSMFICDKKKILVFVVFAFFCGTGMGTALEANMSLWEYALFMLTNHYYLIYFMFMTYLFFSLENMNEESELIYVRMGTIGRQYICRAITVFLQAGGYVLLHVVLAVVIGAPTFEWENKFGAAGMNGYDEVMVFLLAFRNYFSSPVLALVVVSVYLAFGLGVISMLLYFLQRILSRKFTVVLVGVLILNVMLGFKLVPEGLWGIFFLNKYFILHHVLFQDGVAGTVLNVGIACGGLVLGYHLVRRKVGNRLRGVRRRMKVVDKRYFLGSAGFVVFYVALCFVSAIIPGERMAAMDLSFSTLLGYSQAGFDLAEFTKYALFFVVPIFFVGAIWERERKARNQLVEIRYGNRKAWRRELLRGINRLVFVYVLLFGVTLLFGMAVFGMFGGADSSVYQTEFCKMAGVSVERMQGMLAAAFVLKGVELFYYKELFGVIESVCRNTIVAFLLTFAGFVPGFVLPDSVWLSFGSSSLYSLASKSAEMGMETAVLSTGVVLLVKILLLRLIERWKKENSYE